MPDLYFLIIGIILALIGAAVLAVLIRQRLACSEKAAAEIISVQKKKSAYWRGRTFCKRFPTYRFKVNENEYTVKYWHHVRGAEVSVNGSKAIIRYDPQSPENIRVGAGAASYAAGILIVLFGLLIIICYFI